MSLVTIWGQLGSGAPEVGRQIADRLQANYVDRQIITEIAVRLHREEREVMPKEMPLIGLSGRIVEAFGTSFVLAEGVASASLPIWDIPLYDRRYLEVMESVVREFARTRSVVIVGQGSQFVLKGYPGAFHVLAVAPLEVRMKRVMTDLGIDQEAAELKILHYDDSQHEFFKKHFKVEAEQPIHYDLAINTGRLSIQAAASTVVDVLSFGDQGLE